ncbi:MAG: sterol-binding protein [Robiginitomaculum sp.]|nr:MAG: sterol-binding protein [Robiginitomaculum sp.]
MSEPGSIEDFVSRAQQAATRIEPFGKSVLFDFGTDGKVFADARQSPVTIEHAASFAARADCRVKTRLKILERLISGSLEPMTAMFSGRLKISGDMNAALELARRLRAADV